MQGTPILSIVIPCYNEETTLEKCVAKVLAIKDDKTSLEIIIVDDCSRDKSHAIATSLAVSYPEIKVVRHTTNQGKGAALRSGFREVTGSYVAVQDADLEYDPQDLKRLIQPLLDGKAEVVFGSRFLSTGSHRVFYFWHYMGNRFLTFLSNMFTDLNLTDMETCYKVFKREVIQSIEIEENRFGFEPEVVAKVAHMRLRIYEMGISYHGRTYLEGKKIGAKDGFRAIYCILRYNLHHAPLPIQFLMYLLTTIVAASTNLLFFYLLTQQGVTVNIAAPIAFAVASIFIYCICVLMFFRRRVRWTFASKNALFLLTTIAIGVLDWWITQYLFSQQWTILSAKATAIIPSLLLYFLGYRFLVFPKGSSGPWK